MNTAIEYLRAQQPTDLSASQLDAYLALLVAAPRVEERRESFNYLLRTFSLTPEQGMALSKSAPVGADMELLLVLQRYVRSKQFATSHGKETERLSSPWALVSEFLRAITGFPPSQSRQRNAP